MSIAVDLDAWMKLLLEEHNPAINELCDFLGAWFDLELDWVHFLPSNGGLVLLQATQEQVDVQLVVDGSALGGRWKELYRDWCSGVDHCPVWDR